MLAGVLSRSHPMPFILRRPPISAMPQAFTPLRAGRGRQPGFKGPLFAAVSM